MARRKKILVPIDLTNPMLVRDEIVLDLLQKFPLGPNKTAKRVDYYQCWDGHPALEEEERPGYHKDACGYLDLDLYRLNLEGYEIRNYVRQRWPVLGAAGITRRSNRLAKRIGQAARRVRRAGLPGLWKLSYGWEDYKEVVVYAHNQSHAEQQGEMFFSPAFVGTKKHHHGVKFIREGTPLDVTILNRKSKRHVLVRIKKLKREMAERQAELERMEYLDTTHDVYGINVVGELDAA